MRRRGRQHVQAVDLIVQDDLTLGVQTVDELVDGFGPIRCPVVDGLQLHHRPTVSAGYDTTSDSVRRAGTTRGQMPAAFLSSLNDSSASTASSWTSGNAVQSEVKPMPRTPDIEIAAIESALLAGS